MIGSQKSRSAADRVAAQLTMWPGLTATRPPCRAGRGFTFHGRQILHLHSGDEADLRLTQPVTYRISTVLNASGQVVTRPGDDWVTVRLDSDTAGSMLISLLSLAIRALEKPHDDQPCSWERAHRRALRG